MKTQSLPLTRAAYAEWLNEIGTPEDDKRSNGGRIPDGARFGDWTRRNDPIAFNVGLREWRENQAHRSP